MRLRPDDDALAFAASVRELLARSCDRDALREAWGSDDGRVPGLWKRLAEIGVPGLTVPERYGGAGMDLTAAVPVLVECGRAALPEPVAATVAGVELLRAADGTTIDAWLARVAAGDAMLAMGDGSPAVVAGARWADLMLLSGGGVVHLLPRERVRLTRQPSVDPGAGLGVVAWRRADGEPLPTAAADAAFDAACVAVAAELVGLAQGMVEMSVRHARQREQFGRPIGSFQAVKHQLADVYVATAFALPVVHRAAWSVAHRLSTRARDSSHAKHAAMQAAEGAARTALQVHAGIGYTFEHVLHMWLKRTWTWSSLWGDPAFHRRRVHTEISTGRGSARVP